MQPQTSLLTWKVPGREVGTRVLGQLRQCICSLQYSSALNAMIYNRGTIGTFQTWADMVDDQSWTFENLLPFFRKSTNFTPANTELRAANASVPLPANGSTSPAGGPIHTSYSNFALPFTSWIQRAFPEINIPPVQDFFSGLLLGSQYASMLLFLLE